jgi:hypothetical protein
MIGDIIQSIDLGIVNEPVNFKSPSGFVRLSRPQFVTFAKEMAAHVQASFNVEETVINAIKSGAITTASEIDEIFNTDARL